MACGPATTVCDLGCCSDEGQCTSTSSLAMTRQNSSQVSHGAAAASAASSFSSHAAFAECGSSGGAAVASPYPTPRRAAGESPPTFDENVGPDAPSSFVPPSVAGRGEFVLGGLTSPDVRNLSACAADGGFSGSTAGGRGGGGQDRRRPLGHSSSGWTNSPSSATGDSIGMPNVPQSRLLDEYSGFEELGAGDFGTVVAATAVMDQRRYAIKVAQRGIAGDVDEQSRLQEVYALACCAAVPSPHVLQYHDAWMEDHQRKLHIVTELLQGGSARAHLPRPWPEADLADIAVQCAVALTVMHDDCHVAHFDIKPDNVLCSPDARYPRGVRYTVADFGLARPTRARDNRAAHLRGAPDRDATFVGLNDAEGDCRYTCPYLVACGGSTPYETEADIFSLGCTLAELAGGDPRLLRQTWDYSFLSVNGYSAGVVELVRGMTQPDPRLRPPAFAVISAAVRLYYAGRDKPSSFMHRVEALETEIARLSAHLAASTTA